MLAVYDLAVNTKAILAESAFCGMAHGHMLITVDGARVVIAQ